MENNQKEMQHVEQLIGKILRVGVIISAIIIAVGLFLLIYTGQTGYPGNEYPTDFHTIFTGISTFKPYAVIMLGTFCLIFTPVLRVIVSIYAFYKEKDWLYVKITLIVLAILIISFFVGKA